MSLKIQHRNFDLQESLQRLIEKQATKIRKWLPTFSSEVLDLHVAIEKLPRGNQFQTVIVMTLPQRVIRVEDIEDNAASSVQRAFGELQRRVKRFKSELNRERLWHRPVPQAAGESAGQSIREVENIIHENLDKVDNYIRRELLHQTLVERIPPHLIEPQALVDDVFLEVSSKFESKPVNLSFEQWMIQVARDKVQNRIEELASHQDDSHMEESAGVESRWDDEVLNFFQPDEALRVEDLLRDEKISNPEELLARDEIEIELQRAIARLPSSLRESFVLFALEGFNSDEVAMITGKTPEEVIENVHSAREQLREQTRIAGR